MLSSPKSRLFLQQPYPIGYCTVSQHRELQLVTILKLLTNLRELCRAQLGNCSHLRSLFNKNSTSIRSTVLSKLRIDEMRLWEGTALFATTVAKSTHAHEDSTIFKYTSIRRSLVSCAFATSSSIERTTIQFTNAHGEYSTT